MKIKFFVKKSFLSILFLIALKNVFATDTLLINQNQNIINLYNYVSILEDSTDNLTIGQILTDRKQYKFYHNIYNKLNFGFSTSTFWLKFNIKNITDQKAIFLLNIPNPDIDHLDFYKVYGDSLIRETHTGELHDYNSREINHRFFLFRIELLSDEKSEYYLSVNNLGHSLTVPIILVKESHFNDLDHTQEIFNWLIYGILIFIFIFNMYLFHSSRDKLNLYNALNILFATLLLFIFDNYIYYLNPPIFIEKVKWLSASLYTVSLIIFTEAFIRNSKKFKKIQKAFLPLKILAIVFALFYPFHYPISLLTDIGLPIIILVSQILLIIIVFGHFNYKYPPSVLLAFAFCFVFLGMVIHELKELNVFNLNFIVLNSLKIGFSIECILFTFAVLERFRIQQKEAQETIQNSFNKIENQNKELEIINAELEKLSIVASETNNCVAIYDNNGKLEWCNTYFEEFYHTTLYDIIKSEKDFIFNLIPHQKIKDLFLDCITKKTPVTFETHVKTKGKDEIWVQTTLTPLIRKDTVFKLVAIDSDITQLKQYEKNLEITKAKAIESDRLKSVFLGNLSHEIRTPLNGIIGFSELLSNSVINEEKKHKYLKLITNNGEQLIKIIDDILDISLIESDQLRINDVTINLNQFLQDVYDFFEVYRTTINKSSITFTLENRIKSSEANIVTDPTRLKQVLSNLINNAFKFTNEGTVHLTCTKLNDTIHFCVEDSGIGIDQDKKDIVFERFRQADERLNREHGGNGLGLSICKGIVEKMNGEIWVAQKEGKGLKICFYIPYVSALKMADVHN